MKKRMFITTIVMMLVLAVALTTSSLAWFTSANTSVTAQAATFTATSSGSSTVNLKISDTTGSWGNTIKLTSAEGRSMVGMIPQTALIASLKDGNDDYEAPTFTGVDLDEGHGGHVDVVHGNYYWPARMAFNSATIDDESFFIIDKDAQGKDPNGETVTGTDKNGVVNYNTSTNGGVNGSTGFYYDEFYIHNADTQSVINKLTFKVTGNGLSIDSSLAENSDYTCNAYAAFILFDEVAVAVGDPVPSNALHNPGATVVAYGSTPGSGQVAAGSHNYFIAWVPFAAFTIAIDKDNDGLNDNDDVVAEAPWQFADLDATSEGKFVYNRNVNGDGTYAAGNIGIANLPTQQFDALSGNDNDDGFVLNTDSLRGLNNKVINGTTGNVTNTGNASRDTSSEFVMPAGETFKVAFYFWLDGYTMTSFTDTTKAHVGIKIEADQVNS